MRCMRRQIKNAGTGERERGSGGGGAKKGTQGGTGARCGKDGGGRKCKPMAEGPFFSQQAWRVRQARQKAENTEEKKEECREKREKKTTRKKCRSGRRRKGAWRRGMRDGACKEEEVQQTKHNEN